MDQQNRIHVGFYTEELGRECVAVKPDIVSMLKLAKHSFVNYGSILCDTYLEKQKVKSLLGQVVSCIE